MSTLKLMVAHAGWANRRLIQGLIEQRVEDVQIRRLASHIVMAEQIWMTRLQGRDSNYLELWPELEPERCMELASANADSFEAYVEGLDEEALLGVIKYRNQTGRQYDTSVHDILTHVMMHGQYHRGQINTLLRQQGLEPINVDMITFVRQR